MNSPVPPSPLPDREATLLDLVLGKPAGQRDVLLDAVCAGDRALRARLEARLAAVEVPSVPPHGPGPTASAGAGTTEVAAGPEEADGLLIGRYKLVEKLGEGGFGVVWLAEQKEPVRRKVALKIIKPGMDTRTVVARFEAERQALAMMDHPNIARVLDAGITEIGRPYFVMELVRGVRITDYCDQARLSTAERLEIFIRVCQAIQHAHQKGIIHRDIKPSNVLVTLHDGVPVPKVIDFGIAKATQGQLTEKTVHTQFQQFLGTPAYMSPEQAEMSGLDIDTRSDIYSLGVLLYELLAGSTPFDARELMASGIDAMRKAIRETDPQRPSTRLATLGAEQLAATAQLRSSDPGRLLHQLKGDLDWIVIKCLEKDRTRRYETASGLGADLRRHLDHEPVVARPPSAGYRFWKAWARNRLAFNAAAGVAAALVAGFSISSWQMIVARRARADEAAQRRQAEVNERLAREAQAEEARQRRSAIASREQVELNLYAADIAAAAHAVADGDVGLARRLLKEHETPLRGFEWRHLWAASRGDEPILTLRAGSQEGKPAYSPDGTLLAVGDTVWEVASGKPRYSLAAGHTVLAFVHDDELLVTSPDALKLWNPAKNPEPRVLAVEPMVVAGVSPLGTLVATGGRKSGLSLWDTRSWNRIAQAAPPMLFPRGARELKFSPDGKKLLTLTGSGLSREARLEIWSVPDLARIPAPAIDDATQLGVSRDGKVLYTGAGNGTVRAWDMQSLRELEGLRLFRHHRSWISGIAVLADGRIVTTAADRRVCIHDPSDREGLATLHGHAHEIRALAPSPDERSFATIDAKGLVRVWPVESNRRVRSIESLSEGGGRMQFAGLSADGGMLVTLTTVGLKFWRLNAAPVEEVRSLRWEYDPGDLPLDNVFSEGSSTVSPDLRHLAVARPDHSVELWDLRSRTLRRLPRSGAGRYVRFSPDSRLLATTTADRSAVLWVSDTGERFAEMPMPAAEAVRAPFEFSSDGRTLGVGLEGRILLWDIPSRTRVRTIELGVPYQVFSLSPDNRWLAVGEAAGNQIRLFDLATGSPSGAPLEGHVAGINSVLFSPDGRTLFSAGDDSELRLWHVPTRRPMLIRTHRSSVLGGMFGLDGRTLVVGDLGQTIQILRAPSVDEIAAAEAGEREEIRRP